MDWRELIVIVAKVVEQLPRGMGSKNAALDVFLGVQEHRNSSDTTAQLS